MVSCLHKLGTLLDLSACSCTLKLGTLLDLCAPLLNQNHGTLLYLCTGRVNHPNWVVPECVGLRLSLLTQEWQGFVANLHDPLLQGFAMGRKPRRSGYVRGYVREVHPSTAQLWFSLDQQLLDSHVS